MSTSLDQQFENRFSLTDRTLHSGVHEFISARAFTLVPRRTEDTDRVVAALYSNTFFKSLF